jgi:branched-chain amino acid aminotransferase
LEGSILPGLTRDSVVKLASSWGIEVLERRIAIDEVLEAIAAGRLQEAFGTGTAAVISPVGEFLYRGISYIINNGRTGELAARLYSELQAMQNGYRDDPFKWVVRVG